MKKLFVLKKENILLAKDEIAALQGSDVALVADAFVTCEPTWNFENRLAQTRSVHEFTFQCELDKLTESIDKIDWQTFSCDSFYVQVHGSQSITEKIFADMVGPKLRCSKVDVHSPDLRIDLFIHHGIALCGVNGVQLHEEYESRKAQYWSEHHPSAMHPKLARTIINLTGIRDGVLVDPMCGAGGMLIEAAVMGLGVKGYDIDHLQVARCKKNLEQYGVHAIVEQRDATTIDEPIEYLVTDLPYGRSTKSVERTKLYPQILAMIKRCLKKRAVIVFPHYSNYDQYIRESGLHKVGEYDKYIHKTLTRKIVVIEP